jgi:hypothetical protein
MALKTFTKEEVIALCEMQIKQLEDAGTPKFQTQVMKLFTLGLSTDMSLAQVRAMREELANE